MTLLLTEMFQQMKDYHIKLGYDFANATIDERMNAIRDKSLALNQEVAELVDSFPWKPWRSINSQPWDTVNAMEEIVDILFFLGEIMEAAWIDHTMLEDVFEYKLKENYDRIKRGYNNKKEDRRKGVIG